MLLPRTLMWSTASGFLPFGITFTFFRCVFIATSTPAARARQALAWSHRHVLCHLRAAAITCYRAVESSIGATWRL